MAHEFISPYVFVGLAAKTSRREIVKVKVKTEIADIVCAEFGLTFEEVNNQSRRRELVYVRHAIAYWCKKATNMSFKTIGTIFEPSRDHSSVMHSCTTWENLLSYHKEIIEVNKKIEESIKRKYK